MGGNLAIDWLLLSDTYWTSATKHPKLLNVKYSTVMDVYNKTLVTSKKNKIFSCFTYIFRYVIYRNRI